MMNIKINQNIYLLILGIFFLLIVFYLNPNLFILDIKYIKHWTTYHHDDIVFVYNSLLYAEGLDQHHTDHPSLFTFIIFPFFYKLAFYLGFIDFYDLSGFLITNDINFALSKLFFISRLCIQLFSLGIIYIFYKIIIKYTSNNISAFFLTFCLIISTGFSSSSNRIESGLIAVFFILLAFYLFLKFLEKKDKKNLVYLMLVFLLIFSGMMQKKIIYFTLPFLFISSLMFLKQNKIEYSDYKILNSSFLNYKYFLFIPFLLIFLFISYKTVINNTFFLDRDLDFIFLIANYSGFNLLFFLYIRNYQDHYYKNLLTYNILFGCTYFLYKYFLIYFFSAPIGIWSISFTNFLGHLNMFTSSESIKDEFNFGSLYLYFKDFVENLKLVILKYFFTLSFQSLLIWLNAILYLFVFKKIKLKVKLSIYTLLIGFLFIQSVILFRYEQDTYFLNSEFFLLFSLAILLKYFETNIKSLIISCTFLILLIFSNIEHFDKIKTNNRISYCLSFEDFDRTDMFYQYWTSKIPLEKRKEFCNDYLY